MCGITGVFFHDGSRAERGPLKAANDLLAHRGPDDEGFFTEGPVGLAMRRLAIIDLNTGHQPISYDDDKLTIVFNGEIYNFQSLRGELLAKGHVFKTQSDTEVILALYKDLGKDCVKKLRGMFAFAVWDRPRRRLFIARDRIGKKPLFYSNTAQRFAFGSEIRTVFQWPGASREVDAEALDLYLSLQYIPSPWTIYEGVRKLPPGHTLTLENGKIEIEKYWELPLSAKPATTDFEEAKGLVVDKLRESVKLRMISDVPLGAFLSGGVDSSIIVALMAEQSARPVKTFSIGFEEQEFSELHYAKAVAEQYGCEHTEFIVKPQMTDILPKLAWHYGEPYADSSALPSYYVARETRKFVTVALNGDGGDENFAGYVRYFAMKAARLVDILPGPAVAGMKAAAEYLPERNAPYGLAWRAKRFLRSVLHSEVADRHLRMICYFPEDEKDALYGADFKKKLGTRIHSAQRYMRDAFAGAKGEDFVNAMLYVDFKTYMPECLMTKVDIATMAASLEGRSPLLDHEFVELVYPFPGHWKLKGLRGHKHLMKEAFKDKLPALIRNRNKMGFGIPLHGWFRGPLKDFAYEMILSEKSLARGYFSEAGLRKLWDDHQSRRRENGYRLWALLMLELWHRECLEKPADVMPCAHG
jgi:asparagine synthase (glutamine-hydrolysing)